MRKFKFRAWLKKQKRFYPLDRTDSFSVFDDEDVIVTQFTGLFDREGKEIWEGDVLATQNDGKDGCDVWEEYVFQESVQWSNYGACFIGLPDDDENSIYGPKYCYVKGNIYEHPHILKEVK